MERYETLHCFENCDLLQKIQMTSGIYTEQAYKPLCPTVVWYAFIVPYLGGISMSTSFDILLMTFIEYLRRQK